MKCKITKLPIEPFMSFGKMPIANGFLSKNEFNQEYWSGQHCDSHSQEYPEDWVKRTQQRPRHTTFSNSNY